MKKFFNTYLKGIKSPAYRAKSYFSIARPNIFQHKRLLNLSNPSGAVLLTVVVLIVIIGLTGVAIYSLTTTSTFSQLSSQNATQAFYLAESGFRVVASEYNQAAAGNKNTVLENLHNTTLSLPGNAGQFDIRLYPYWFYVSGAYTKGAATIRVKVPGGIPLRDPADPSSLPISFPTTGSLKLRGKTQLALITNSFTSGNVITFNLNTAVSPPGFPYDIQAGDELFLVYEDNATPSQTIAQNTSITLPGSNPLAQILPAKKGSFRIYNENNDKMDYTYHERLPAVIDPASPPTTITLTQIDHQDPGDASVFPIQIDNTTEFYLGKNLAVYSTSTFGQGSMAGKKTLVNYTDVGLDAGFSTDKETISFAEDIQDFSPTMNDPNPSLGKPIEIIDTELEQSIKLGGNLPDSYGSVWYAGDTDIANCIEGRCDLGKGFNAYFEFQFDNTDTDEESKTYGDGFTFAIISGYEDSPGNYRNTVDDTGSGGEYLGYAGPGLDDGLQPPKIAVEFDTYPNPGGGNICPPSSDSRRDDTPAANHAALVYWGEDTPGSFDAAGGYLSLGSTDFGSPDTRQGTISFWFKRDTKYNGNGYSTGDRLWGQNANMEIRFSSDGDDLILDWGNSDSLIYNNHPFTEINKWYFIAIAWNEASSNLVLYGGTETIGPASLKSSDLWSSSVSNVGVSENLFLNSSGGDGNKRFHVDGKGVELRHFTVQRTIDQIQADYNRRLNGNESDLHVYLPLQADLVDRGPAGITPEAKEISGDTGWSNETPSEFDCGIAFETYDDNRHGTGGVSTPLNSINTDSSAGTDGYHQVSKGTDAYNWLEDGLPHKFRMELIRPIDPATDGNPSNGAYDYQMKVWVDCPDCSEAELGDFKKVQAPFTSWAPLIQKTIAGGNPLELEQSIHDDLQKILFGFTQGTGGATQNLTIRDFELYFLKRYPPGYPDAW